MVKIKLSKYIDKVFQTKSDPYSEWFGYYNYDTLTSDHSKLLCNRIKEDGVLPRPELKVEVGYYDVSSGEWHHVGVSDSWNWQQGCMAQWLNDEEIIYNSSEGNHHIAIIHNIKTGSNRKINWAIYGITPDGKSSITLDMERAHWCRAYHYESVVDESKDGKVYDKDGVFEVDLVNNTCRRIIPIQDIIALDYRPYFKKAKHWLEHIMINQEGTKFCILHRFSSVTNVYSYKTRLIIVDMKSLQMQCVPGWETTQWSHFGWNADAFAIYAYPSKKKICERDFAIGEKVESTPPQLKQNQPFSFLSCVKLMIRTILPRRIFQKLKGGVTSYEYYQRDNGIYHICDKFDVTPFLMDGHPSFTPNGRYMLTDTYPDSSHYQKLYVFDIITKKYLLLGTFYANYDKTPSSCDLHPKLSRDGQYLVVDSAHDERHHMIILKLNWDLIIPKLL